MIYTLRVRSRAREQLVEFTDEVQRRLTESGAREGVCVLYVQHTTAGLTVNENADPDVASDMLLALRTLIPQHGMGFRHGEQNSDAHIKASLVGRSGRSRNCSDGARVFQSLARSFRRLTQVFRCRRSVFRSGQKSFRRGGRR